ncbi:MAG: PQQ-binding-like beta-propeller repeat protein [Ktedonobacteraceae bacterium]|nr:PQQ-binding-like beta-propeller repeat protein [Ktedonobacteraceae bacterium]
MKQSESRSRLIKFLIVLLALFCLPLLAIGKTVFLQADDHSASVPKQQTLAAQIKAPVVPVGGHDWPMYLHDLERTSASDETILTPTNVGNLVKNWSFHTQGGIAASAIVADGTVYVGSWDGSEYALDEMTGKVKWKRFLGLTTTPRCFPKTLGITSSATVDNGIVYVGGGDTYWYALNATTGDVLWRIYTGDNGVTGGHYNWASPLIYNGYAYIGIASNCDNPLVPGKVMRVSLKTHEVVNTFNLVDDGQTGGGIWTSPSIDIKTGTLFLATGTESLPDQPLAQAVIALDATTLQLKSVWKLPEKDAIGDSDFDTTPILFSDAKGTLLVAAINKNGYIYVFNRNHIGDGPVWKQLIDKAGMCPVCEESSVSSNTIGGGLLYVAAGNTTIDGVTYRGSVEALDPNTGKFVWRHGETGPVIGSLLYTNGLVVAAAGPNVEVLDAKTGKRLFAYRTGKPIYSSPTLAHGQIFEGSLDGNVYAFRLPDSEPTSASDTNCPAGWVCQDIGNPVLNGSETMSGGKWSVSAGGTGSGGIEDQLRFVAQNVGGDLQIKTKVVSQQSVGIGGSTQVGLMIRQNSDTSSPYYAVLLTAGNKVVVQYRQGYSGDTQGVLQTSTTPSSLYLQIQRHGDQFQAATSRDGKTYTLVPGSTITVVLPYTISAGLVVSSSNADTMTTALFSDLTISLPDSALNPPQSTSSCPREWTCQDVGNPAVVGSQSTHGKTWTVEGGGVNIWWDSRDDLHYIHKPLKNDGGISARVVSQTAKTLYIKSGLMIRQSMAPDAPYYAVFVEPDSGSGIIIVERRTSQGIINNQLSIVPGKTPIYLKIARTGDEFSAYTSEDGRNWRFIDGSKLTIEMSGPLLMGLAVTSKDIAAANTTIFDAVTTY